MEARLNDLNENVQRILTDFQAAAEQSCGANLTSIVLYGSAAEGRMRPTSDVNLILVLKAYQVDQINPLREKLRIAHAAIKLTVMFILESEIELAAEAFAVKFSDILSRHRVLSGSDPFKSLKVSRSATLQRLRQVVVNLTLRLRERYALVSLREEQLMPIIADAAGPIRACAATILSLEGKHEIHPKEALQNLTQRLGGDWTWILEDMSAAREQKVMPAGKPSAALLGVLDLLAAMQKHIQGLK